jgi:hypothetical protein
VAGLVVDLVVVKEAEVLGAVKEGEREAVVLAAAVTLLEQPEGFFAC